MQDNGNPAYAGKIGKGRAVIGVLLALLLVSVAICMPVAAGSISVDTTGLTGKVTDTILVPVVITDPKEVCAWQMDVETGDTADAKIVFNRDSVIDAGAASSESTIYWTESSDRSRYLSKDQTLFYLAVTPKREGDIPLIIKNVKVGESDANGWAVGTEYDVHSGVLHVSGMGSGQTIGDSSSGATVFTGVMTSGYLRLGDGSGLRSITLDNKGEVAVTIFWDTCKPYELPSSFTAAEKFTLNLDTPDGTPMKLEIGISKAWLASNGKTIDDVIVLRNLYGKWYSSAISSVAEDGEYYVVTINSWSSGSAFAIGFDTKGTVYPSETLRVIQEGGEHGFSLDGAGWIIGVIIGGGLILVLIIIIIVVRKRRKDDDEEKKGEIK